MNALSYSGLVMDSKDQTKQLAERVTANDERLRGEAIRNESSDNHGKREEVPVRGV